MRMVVVVGAVIASASCIRLPFTPCWRCLAGSLLLRRCSGSVLFPFIFCRRGRRSIIATATATTAAATSTTSSGFVLATATWALPTYSSTAPTRSRRSRSGVPSGSTAATAFVAASFIRYGTRAEGCGAPTQLPAWLRQVPGGVRAML